MKKNILIVCPYPENQVPGQRLKYEQYFEYLRANGYRITVSPFIGNFPYRVLYSRGHYGRKIVGVLWGYTKRTLQIVLLPFYDGTYVSLYVTPFGTSFFERMYRLFSKKMIYDIDDLVFMNRTSPYNSMVAPLRRPGKYFYLMRAADHVITCTPYLDSMVRRFNSSTTDISSTINTEKYVPVESYVNDHKLILGWTGTHSNIPYLRLLVPVLQRLSGRYDFKLLVIGTREFKIDGVDVEAIPWREATEVQDLRRIDIGLYPLENEEWVLGKSGLKALQYMGLGIPTVATAIGASFRVIEHGVSGFLVDSDDSWASVLAQLMESPELRREIGRKGRERVEQFYSVRANATAYLKIFKDIY